jgi:hypothetical protein
MTPHKLEFLKFNGSGDPLPWLNRCERHFHVRRTPEHQRVAFTAFYFLDDVQLWFHRMELNDGRPIWPQFVQLVNARFGPPLTDSHIGEVAMLRCSIEVDEYSKRFVALSCRDITLFEPQQIQLFIIGLRDPLDVVIFTRVYEQHNASRDAVVAQLPHSLSRLIGRSTMTQVPTALAVTPAVS